MRALSYLKMLFSPLTHAGGSTAGQIPRQNDEREQHVFRHGLHCHAARRDPQSRRPAPQPGQWHRRRCAAFSVRTLGLDGLRRRMERRRGHLQSRYVFIICSIFIALLYNLSGFCNEILHNLSRWSRRQASERISCLFAVARGLLDQTSVCGEQDSDPYVLVQVLGLWQRRVELLKIYTISCNYADFFSCQTLCRKYL